MIMTFINSSNNHNNENESGEDKDSITSGVEIIATINPNQDNDVFQNTDDEEDEEHPFDDEPEDEECDSSHDQASKAKTFFGVDVACGSCSRKNIVLGALAGGLLLLVLVSGTFGMVQSKVDQQVISSSAAVVAAAKAPKAKATKAPKGGGDFTLSPTSKPTNSPTTGGGGGGCNPKTSTNPVDCFQVQVSVNPDGSDPESGHCVNHQDKRYAFVAFSMPQVPVGIISDLVDLPARVCVDCVMDDVPTTFRGFEIRDLLGSPVTYCLYDFDATYDYAVSGSCKDGHSNPDVNFHSAGIDGTGSGPIHDYGSPVDASVALCVSLVP